MYLIPWSHLLNQMTAHVFFFFFFINKHNTRKFDVFTPGETCTDIRVPQQEHSEFQSTVILRIFQILFCSDDERIPIYRGYYGSLVQNEAGKGTKNSGMETANIFASHSSTNLPRHKRIRYIKCILCKQLKIIQPRYYDYIGQN